MQTIPSHFGANPAGESILTVRAGMPAPAALEQASALLAAAAAALRALQLAALDDHLVDGLDERLLGVRHLVETGRALVDSVPRDEVGHA